MNKMDITLKRMRKKEEYLKNLEARYAKFTAREWDILRAGWAACETLIGIEQLEETSQSETTI